MDAGVTFIDTANAYGNGQSEHVVGKAIKGNRNDVVIATKVHMRMSKDPNGFGNSRRHIKLQCDQALRRLGTEYIDLYQMHRPDRTTPIQESLEALDELVRAGKVHYVGVSTFMPTWLTMEALSVAEKFALRSAPVSEQPPYNLLDRRIENDLIPLAQKYGLAVIPWSPLASRNASQGSIRAERFRPTLE